MRLTWLLACLLLLYLPACNIINPEEDEPAFVLIEEPLLIEGNDTLENAFQEVWLFHGNDYYGTFQPPTTLPFIGLEKPNGNRLFSRPGVWTFFDADRHEFYPFVQFDTALVRLERGGRFTYRPIYRYFPDSLLTYAFVEDFEGSDVQFQRFGLREDTARLERHTLDAYRGNNCGIVEFNDQARSLEVISTIPMVLPRGTQDVWLEVKFKGNIRFAASLVAEGFGFGQEALPLIILTDGYNDDNQWRAAYFKFNELLAQGFPGATFKLRFFALSDGSSRRLLLDDIRLIHFQ